VKGYWKNLLRKELTQLPRKEKDVGPAIVRLKKNPDGSYYAVAKTDAGKIRIKAPPPPCLDRENWSKLCPGGIPLCAPFAQGTEDTASHGCKEFEKCVAVWEPANQTRKERVQIADVAGTG